MSRVEIVPARLAVKAMRDNGYKNAAYAVAELMDNSIQAGATLVELLCVERKEFVAERTRSRIERVAVLDNGRGMDTDVLRMALQFGNGTNLEAAQQTHMGKFGMGLPASSVSQASRVDVWSWQHGIESAVHSYLDIDEIIAGEIDQVPEPRPRAIPSDWLGWSTSFGRSGTLVVWSKIDRCVWRTGRAIIENSELLIGRMYRKFLHEDRLKIRLACIDQASLAATIDQYARPNDPMFLMPDTSTPEPYDKEPMFEPYPNADSWETAVKVRYGGATHAVAVRFSMAKAEARAGGSAGNRGYGQYAQKNIGVSVVRARRELELDAGWAMQGEPRERWWGVEVEFPPALDEIFGVTNNKQHARNFSELAGFDVDDLVKDKQSITAVREEMERDGDPHAALLEVAYVIQRGIRSMRLLIAAQMKNQRSREIRHAVDGMNAEKEATEKTRTLQAEGNRGESDAGESLPLEKRKAEIQGTLVEQGMAEVHAKELTDAVVTDSLKYVFSEASLDSPAFFSVQPRGGTLIVTLNTRHPAYNRLVDVLEKNPADQSSENLVERLNNALEGLKLLLMAWARYEDEQDSSRRERAQDARVDWGRIARRFLARAD